MRINWCGDRILLAIFSILLMAISSAAQAQQIRWSFAEHPQPVYDDLTMDEIIEIERIETMDFQSNPGRYCAEMPRVYFEIYNDRYPAFANVTNETSRYRAWKEYIVEYGRAAPSACIVGDVAMQLSVSTSWPTDKNLVYCGKYSRAPQIPQENGFYELVDELVKYAELRSPLAISSLLLANSYSPPIALNTDVEFFLRKTLEQMGERKWYWDTSHLVPSLTKERREFLDKALETHDLALVLQTTQPCAE